jgi:hypothetical protein
MRLLVSRSAASAASPPACPRPAANGAPVESRPQDINFIVRAIADTIILVHDGHFAADDRKNCPDKNAETSR